MLALEKHSDRQSDVRNAFYRIDSLADSDVGKKKVIAIFQAFGYARANATVDSNKWLSLELFRGFISQVKAAGVVSRFGTLRKLVSAQGGRCRY